MLYLLPNLITEGNARAILSPEVVDAASELTGLFAESERAARRYLALTKKELEVVLISEESTQSEIQKLLRELPKDQKWGIVSDAGLPCIADPGSALVLAARAIGIQVRAFAGPCSFIIALQLSGLPGQKFAFHGYLERDEMASIQMVKKLEVESRERGTTQLFMEPPHANIRGLKRAIDALSDTTILSLAVDVTGPSELVITRTVAQWKKQPLPDLKKLPAILLFAVPSTDKKDRQHR